MQRVYSDFGLKPEMRLSTRPAEFLGAIETWNRAEAELKRAMMAQAGESLLLIDQQPGITVVEPISNGIGSDLFALVWDGHGLAGLNASGRSPARLDAQRLLDAGEIPLRGWDAVTVPGAVAGWAAGRAMPHPSWVSDEGG